jgi:hypothetical protein
MGTCELTTDSPKTPWCYYNQSIPCSGAAVSNTFDTCDAEGLAGKPFLEKPLLLRQLAYWSGLTLPEETPLLELKRLERHEKERRVAALRVVAGRLFEGGVYQPLPGDRDGGGGGDDDNVSDGEKLAGGRGGREGGSLNVATAQAAARKSNDDADNHDHDHDHPGGVVVVDGVKHMVEAGPLPPQGCNLTQARAYRRKHGDHSGRTKTAEDADRQKGLDYHLPRVVKALRKHGLPPIIAHGTTLSFHRECGAIQGDRDGDFWVPRSYFPTLASYTTFATNMQSSGYTCRITHGMFGAAGWQFVIEPIPGAIESNEELRVGLPVQAMFAQDKKWYEAKIVGISKHEATGGDNMEDQTTVDIAWSDDNEVEKGRAVDGKTLRRSWKANGLYAYFDAFIIDEDFATGGCQEHPCKWTAYLSSSGSIRRCISDPTAFTLITWLGTTMWAQADYENHLISNYGKEWTAPGGGVYKDCYRGGMPEWVKFVDKVRERERGRAGGGKGIGCMKRSRIE